jgi:steroid delta-isomerase-like uncharacterized protein
MIISPIKKEIIMSVTSTADQHKAIIRELYEVILNTGQLDRLNQRVAADYIGGPGQAGPAGFANTIRELRHGFPDIRWTIEDLVAEGDRVVIRWRWQGTHQGDFRGFPASGKTVTNTAIAIYQFKDDQIAQSWLQTDQLGFLKQMGAVPQDVGGAPQPSVGNN